MKRRINIAAGLLHDPQVIYMDEPTVGIDPQSRRRILDTVKQLRDQRGMTVLYTTHLMEEAQELSDRVGIIDHGEIIALGTPGRADPAGGRARPAGYSRSARPWSARKPWKRIRSSVEGVTKAIFDPPGEEGEDKTNVSGIADRQRQARPPGHALHPSPGRGGRYPDRVGRGA